MMTPDDTLKAAAAWAAACLIRDRAFTLYQTAFAGGASGAVVGALFTAHNLACDDVSGAWTVFDLLTTRDARHRA